MADRTVRRTRVTLRCLREDLGIEAPPVEVDLGRLDHPLIRETRRAAPTAPLGMKRILAIERPLIYRLCHGGWRSATWVEKDAARFWLCAGAARAQGAGDDAYAVFLAIHRTDRLLPDRDDRLRDTLERNARVIDDAADRVRSTLVDAIDQRGSDVVIRFGGLIDSRLHVTATGDEVWLAIATQAADGGFIDERLRDLLFRLVFDAADAEASEPRGDWPSGELAWFEVARLALRDPG